MSLEGNKAVVCKFIEAYNERKLNLIDDFVSPEYVDHSNSLGREGLKQIIAMGLNAFPDWHETVEDIIAEGDKVWVLLKYTGTHNGDFMGLSPTGKKITSKAVDIYRIIDGKLAEYWNVTDNINIFKQVGAIEVTEKGKNLLREV
ncbi:MAG TPA: ester cyclase [Candidatus Nanoarchaeia archaeon]|nr:ester cyclase [Candidatus Nanoarchaeia archaeon]